MPPNIALGRSSAACARERRRLAQALAILTEMVDAGSHRRG